MKPGFFIDRPVFSTVLSILIVIVGIIGLALLPVDQYPQITPPVVKISATYPGASALTVSQAVATPIEQELNGTPGMIYMQSSSSNSGSLNITVTFDVSADADLAAVEIQNRVKLAESRLPAEVIQMLICYCKERARKRGSSRNPSLRTIEKEAYAWAERGIDSIEEASAFIQAQNVRASRLAQLMQALQIRGRNLTPAEERYAQSWLEMGFDNETVSMAYERTCLNTGGLNWAYMNKILQRWHGQGLHTAQAVQAGDRKTDAKSDRRPLDADEAAAIKRMFQEG